MATTKAARPEPELMELPVEKLFIDGVHEKIMYANVRIPHGSDGPGYGRDPADRPKWLSARAAKFKQALLRPLEVSARPDGTFAIIDGGGRWWMAQKNQIAKLWCRVHRGLTRKEEAELYIQFDKELYHQRQVDRFLAGLSAGDPICVGIDECIKPYSVEKGGVQFLEFPSLLSTIFNGGGTGGRVLARTSKIIANTWGSDDGEFGTGFKVGVADFGSIALLVSEAPAGWNEGILRDVMKRADYTPPRLRKLVAARDRDKSNRMTWAEKSLLGASILAQRFNAKSRTKIEQRDLRMSDLFARMSEGGGSKIAFGSHLVEHDLRTKKKKDADDE